MSGALAFIAGLGSGYMAQSEREAQRKRLEAKDAQETQQFQWQAQDRARQDQERQALRNAGQPIAMTEGAGGMVRPDTMDNRDVGLPENASQPNNGLMPVAYRVGAQPFANRNDAQAEVASQNSPAGIQGRRVAALEGLGRFDEADRAKAVQLQLAEATRRYQDEGYGDALKALRTGDAAGAVAAFNKSGSMKIQGDMKLTPKEIDLPGHGKITSYDASFNLVNPDGSIRPMTINSHDATMASMPYEKFLKAGIDASREVREGKEVDAKVGYYGALAGLYGAKTGNAVNPTEATAKPFKMDEDDKLRFTEANKGLHEANKALNDAMGKLMPGDDPTKAPAVVHAQGLVKAAKLQQLKTSIQVGVITPEQMVSEIMGFAENPEAVMRSLSELSKSVGPEFTEKVGTLIMGSDAQRRAFEAENPGKQFIQNRQIPANDVWLRMIGQAMPKPQPPLAALVGVPGADRSSVPGQPMVHPAAPAAVQPPRQSIAAALGASETGGNTIDRLMREKVPQFKAAAQRIEVAKTALAAAAKSQDPVALQRYAADVQSAREQLDQMLKGMNLSQANAIRHAIGTY